MDIKPLDANRTSVMSDTMYREMKRKEDAAITMCGGMLGDCYIMADVLDSLIVDAMAVFQREAWYRQSIKKKLRDAQRALRMNLSLCRSNSASRKDIIMELTDQYYDGLRKDYYLMQNGTRNELGRMGRKDAEAISHLICIEVIFQYIEERYKSAIDYMLTIHFAYYDSWFYQAKQADAHRLWNEAITEYDHRYVDKEIDLNKIVSLVNGSRAFDNRFRAISHSDIKENIEAEMGEDTGNAVFDKACQEFGFNRKVS